MIYLLTAAAAAVCFNESTKTFVVGWSRALQWQQKFKVSFCIKIPPNWVTNLLKMLQSPNGALQFSRRRFRQVVHLWKQHNLRPTPVVLLESFSSLPHCGCTLTSGSSGEPYLSIYYQKIGPVLWQMLKCCDFWGCFFNFQPARDNSSWQNCQRSFLQFCRCWNYRRLLDLDFFWGAMVRFTVGLFVCWERRTLWGSHTREWKWVAARPF